MGSFRSLAESKLAEFDDSALIEYAVAARNAGADTEATLALRIFAFGMEDPVRRFIQGRLGSQGDVVVEEILERTLESALRSIESLAGSTSAEARAFVFRIARRRIADHLRKARPRIGSLDDEDGPGSGPAPAGLQVGDQAGAVESGLLIDELLSALRPAHREAVELNVLSGYSARETAEMIRSRDGAGSDDSMSEQNVHQIASRFRKELRSRIAGEVEGVSG